MIWLGNEDAVRRHLVALRSTFAGRDDDVHGRPTISYGGCQFQSVRRTRQIDVGEDRMDVVAELDHQAGAERIGSGYNCGVLV